MCEEVGNQIVEKCVLVIVKMLLYNWTDGCVNLRTQP